MLWVVSGTGTGIGKTAVATALTRAIARAGGPVAGWKPVETGVEAGLGPDQRALLAEGTFHVKHSAHLTFPLPASPHLAARAAGTTIALAPIAALAADLRRDRDVVIELAGGLFTPLAGGLVNVDLVLALAPDRHLMVVPDRLGALHDAIATTTAATARGAAPNAVLVNQCAETDPSLGNAAELRRYVALPVFGPLRYGDIVSRAEQLASMLGIGPRPA